MIVKNLLAQQKTSPFLGQRQGLPADERDKKITLLLDDLVSLESYVHDLFSFSPLPICLVSPEHVILEVNPAFEKVSGFHFEEIVGEPIERIFEGEKIQALIGSVLEEESVQGQEMKIFPKGGGPLPIQAFARARKNEEGTFIGFFLGLFDLSKIKKTEAELIKSQNALLNILEDTDEARRRAEEERKKTEAIITHFADGLLVFNARNRLILINPRAEDYLGLSREKVIGRHYGELADLPKFQALFEVLKAGKKISRKELELHRDLIIDVSIIEMKEKRTKMGYFVVLHDITREKIVERLKTEFVSISAHQLRTPLSAIKWTLRMLLEGDMGKINKEQKKFLNQTYRSNERMIELVNSLLNVTRIEEGRFLYKPVLIDIGEIAKSVFSSYRVEAKKRQIDLQFKKPAEPLPKILVDREKVKLVFQNLVDNAVRYSLPGKKVEVSLRKYKGMVQFKIKDQGVGIPKHQQKRLFTKFFRASNVMRLETAGTGLGLFIAKNVVEAHGGKIGFKSEENKGSTFWVSLPIRRRTGRGGG